MRASMRPNSTHARTATLNTSNWNKSVWQAIVVSKIDINFRSFSQHRNSSRQFFLRYIFKFYAFVPQLAGEKKTQISFNSNRLHSTLNFNPYVFVKQYIFGAAELCMWIYESTRRITVKINKQQIYKWNRLTWSNPAPESFRANVIICWQSMNRATEL